MKGKVMLRWALFFLIIAMLAAIVGFGGVAASFAAHGRMVCVVFLTLFAISLLSTAVHWRISDDQQRDDELTSD